METHSVHGAQKTIEKLEQKVHELETELAGEQRRHGESQKSLRRHERRLAELTEQMDVDFKAKEREQDLIDRLQQKMKQYKRQLDEAEEIASVNLAKYRKLQHDLEEAETRARLAEKSLNQHRALNRSTTSVEETVQQTQSGVTVKKTTTTRTQIVSSESRSEQSNELQRVTSTSSAGSKSQLAIDQ